MCEDCNMCLIPKVLISLVVAVVVFAFGTQCCSIQWYEIAFPLITIGIILSTLTLVIITVMLEK